MKRKILLIILALLLVGCAKSTEVEETSQELRIKNVENGFNYTIYVDTETGVAYLRCYQAGVCIMVDEEGNPLIYTE